jgi:chitobiase/beta-hexosaminidase-like protein
VKRYLSILLALAAACAFVAGDAGGAASSYPSPLELRSTAATGTTTTWRLDTSTGAVNSATNNVPAQNETGWFAFDPGVSSTTAVGSLPTTTEGNGWVIDPVGGATGFPAGDWTFTVKTDIPNATPTAGAAMLTIGVWKGTFSGGVFTVTGTLLDPTDDPLGQDIRPDGNNVITTVTYTLPKASLAAGETLFVDLWRHQVDPINTATASELEVDLLVNDGVTQVTHPAADDTAPTHAITAANVSGGTYFDSGTTTLYYRGSSAGSFTVDDAITDSGSGEYSVNYPVVSTSGWTHADETVTTGSSFTSSAYSWTAGSTTSPGAQTITGEDAAQQQSTSTLTITNDSTAPSGHTVALSGGPGYSTLSVPLTLGNGSDSGSGLDATSAVVERATATDSSGTCGTFGSYSTVTLTSGADTTVTTGNCYRYRYLISDNVGNQSAASSASADAIVDTTAPTVTNAAPTEVSGTGDQYYDATSDTLFFRPAATGSFTMNATPADTQSGIASVAFPSVAATSGWTGSTGGSDASSPYASPVNYTWTAGAGAPGAVQVTATNVSGLTATDTMTIAADSIPPTGGSIALVGGPYYTTASVATTVTVGVDATGGAGIDSTRAVIERAAAPLSAGTCGTFGAFAAVVLTSGADTTGVSGNCYRYQYKAIDNVGNIATIASTPSGDAKVDTTAATAPTLTFSGLTNVGFAGTTLYFKPGGSGAFTVTAAATDTQSGVASYAFPTIAGWTNTGSGSSQTYSFTGSPAATTQGVTATNNAALTSTATNFTLAADSTPPTVNILCNGIPCSTVVYKAPVTITMTATDTGSGEDKVVYTTNGTTPDSDTGTEYQEGFSVSSQTTLRVRAYDIAGNASLVITKVIRVGTAARKLTFSAPTRLSARRTARQLQARIRTSARATVAASLRGPGLKKPVHWRFVVKAGTSVVDLRLTRRPQKSGTHVLTWTVTTRTSKTTRVTHVVFTAPAKAKPKKKR